MNRILGNSYLLLTLRLILGAVFVFAAIEKISDPSLFAQSIMNFRLLPEFSVNFFALVLPWLELTSGLFLLLGLFSPESSLILFSMLLVFTTAVFIALLRGLNIDCGCFGTISAQKVGIQKLIENLFLIGSSLLVILKGSGRFSLENFLSSNR